MHAADQPSASPSASAETQLTFSTPAELQIVPFAGEPMVIKPTQVDVDEQGRVWVLSSAPGKFGPLDDVRRIVILEDTDRDGAADKATVFYQDPSIVNASAMRVLGKQIIVWSAPKVFVLTDIDGDGQADRRALLLTTVGGGKSDSGCHGLVFGPDGKLYLSTGRGEGPLRSPVQKECPLHGEVRSVADGLVANKAGSGSQGSVDHSETGAVYRCNPDGTGLESIATNFQSPGALAVDSFGNIWRTDADPVSGQRSGRINFVMEHGDYGVAASRDLGARDTGPSESVPGVVPPVFRMGSGLPAGLCLYEGKTLPRKFWYQIFVCDPGSRAIRFLQASADGAGYKADAENLVSSDEAQFQPVDLSVAPDGSVYIADYGPASPGSGSATWSEPPAKISTGGIYRLARKGSRPSVPPQDWATPHGWVGALQSGNQTTRYLAWTKLNEAQGSAERYLLMLARALDASYKARALQLLARINGSEDKYIGKCLLDTNAAVREAGLRTARERKRDLVPLITSLSKDPSPEVRRECAIALRDCPSPEAPRLWAELASQYDGRDRWYLEALGIGADTHWDSFLEAWLARVGEAWNSSGNREIVWRSRANKSRAMLERLANDTTISNQERERFRQAIQLLGEHERNARPE